MEEKPQFYIEIWCGKPEGGIDAQISKIVKLDRIYEDKRDVEKHTIDIINDHKEYCKKYGNRIPTPGHIYNEQEYKERTKGKPITPRVVRKS